MDSHQLLRASIASIALVGTCQLSYAAAGSAALPALETRCLSGGVGETERDALRQQQEQYSFWLTTAARQSGAYLSGVRVQIFDTATTAKNTTASPVLACTMDGPWLLAALAPGRYQVEARYRESDAYLEQVMKKNITIGKNGRQQMVMYFDVSDADVIGPRLEQERTAPGTKK
jgi:hypothetical protein